MENKCANCEYISKLYTPANGDEKWEYCCLADKDSVINLQNDTEQICELYIPKPNPSEILEIVNGLNNGVIRIGERHNFTVCLIGDIWFFFLSTDDETLPYEELVEKYSARSLATMIFEAIQGLDDDEQDYIKAVLEEC